MTMRKAAMVVATYLGVVAVVSLWAFLHLDSLRVSPTTVTHPPELSEYGGSSLLAELIANAAVGALLGALSRNLRLALLTAAFAVLLDVDHTLWFLGFPVPGRPDHCPAFVLIAALLMGAVFRDGGAFNGRLSAIVLGSFLGHVAVDLWQGDDLPLLLPFSAERISVHPAFGLVCLAAGALSVALAGRRGASGPAKR